MKIAVDGSLLGARFSGVARSVAQLLAHLPDAVAGRHQVVVFVGAAFDSYLEKHQPDGLDPRLEVVRCSLDNTSRTKRAWWQQVVLPRLCHGCGADLLHSPAYFAPALAGLPLVVTLYDLIGFEAPHLLSPSSRLYHKLVIPAGTRAAQQVIVPSATVRRAVARWLPHVYERTQVIPLGVEERFFAPADPGDQEIRERYRLPDEYLLWVGNVEPKKNVTLLLQAVSHLVRAGREVPKLVVAGALSDGSGEVMREFVRAGLQQRVQFVGRVRDNELPALYRGASLFCFPSLHEGFGLPPLEAMAAGVPTLVANREALAEVAGDAAVVLPPSDPAAWAEAIAALLADPLRQASLRARGRARALEFGWAEAARRTVEVYETAVAVGQDEYDHRSGHVLYAAD